MANPTVFQAARLSRFAVAAIRAANLFAMAPTKQLDSKTSSRPETFRHRSQSLKLNPRNIINS
jgi:hypothetical protein